MLVATMLALDAGSVLVRRIRFGDPAAIFEQAAFIAIVYFFIYGNLVYQLSRLGYLKRIAAHRPAPRRELEAIYSACRTPSLVVLIPSYREEKAVVRRSLLSAALMEYPDRKVALLIDDPPNPRLSLEADDLAATRRLPAEIRSLLAAGERKFKSELVGFRQRMAKAPLNYADETRRLASLYRQAATFYEEQANSFEVRDHTDRLFVERILIEPARQHRTHATVLAVQSRDRTVAISEIDLLREYRRLATLFAVRLTTFERKRFVNLSHASNKAMNLNSYMALIGGEFREVIRSDGLNLEPCDPAVAQLRVPQADYIITLDADSLVLNDYALRLVHFMEQPENHRVAVAQTPYSAIPAIPNVLERVAGATTDIQYVMHQGFTNYNATYWVGANALLRRTAMEDICEIRDENGYPVKRYIQDRTVIEDTESSVDLIDRGWSLHNYPERLAYSATPSDFGALVIQRRRWANGGLIILAKLLRYLARGPRRWQRSPEAFLRIHYLTSLAAVSAGMLMLFVYPFGGNLRAYSWLPLTALPYLVLYGRDLVANDYGWSDLARIYTLNLVLVPVNLGGACRSIYQWWTGHPSPFIRTPKVLARTATPAAYVLMIAAMFLAIWSVAGLDVLRHRWYHGIFEVVNGLLLGYGIVRFVGLRAASEDLGARLTARSDTISKQTLNDLAAGSGKSSALFGADIPLTEACRVEPEWSQLP
jgi:cellulose synthase/poly-beta-1,6-N-acetylglucosamine synthase-like glycosyltransferase